MVNDLRKAMAELRKQSNVNLPEGVTIFRHTYATARLQTTDNSKQIAIWTVAKELGHKNVSRVEDTYGHPSQGTNIALADRLDHSGGDALPYATPTQPTTFSS